MFVNSMLLEELRELNARHQDDEETREVEISTMQQVKGILTDR